MTHEKETTHQGPGRRQARSRQSCSARGKVRRRRLELANDVLELLVAQTTHLARRHAVVGEKGVLPGVGACLIGREAATRGVVDGPLKLLVPPRADLPVLRTMLRDTKESVSELGADQMSGRLTHLVRLAYPPSERREAELPRNRQRTSLRRVSRARGSEGERRTYSFPPIASEHAVLEQLQPGFEQKLEQLAPLVRQEGLPGALEAARKGVAGLLEGVHAADGEPGGDDVGLLERRVLLGPVPGDRGRRLASSERVHASRSACERAEAEAKTKAKSAERSRAATELRARRSSADAPSSARRLRLSRRKSELARFGLEIGARSCGESRPTPRGRGG